MAPGYAGHLSTQSSRIYASPTNGRSADEIKIGLTGLKNLGNSCYMNSTLQCLSATIPLARFLLDGSYKQAINRTNPLGTQGQLATALAGLVHVMWGEKYAFVSPVTFREAMARFAPSFRGYDQHDSQEFLAILLDGLHEDLNHVVTRPPPVEMTPERENELETLPQQIASVKEWSIYRMRNDSLIVDWFQGQFRNKLTCLTCGKTSTTYEAYTYLSLPVPHGRGVGKVTLQQCLDAFVREEVLDKGDMWNCPRCKKPRKATKRLSISRLPQILLIHLKRFSFKGPFTDKIDTTVTFPTNSALDLTNYMPPPLPPGTAGLGGVPVSQSQTPPYLYDLYATTHHFGSLNTGHYTATVRSNREWWYCDDSRIVRGDERQLHTNSPYVLWFRRRHTMQDQQSRGNQWQQTWDSRPNTFPSAAVVGRCSVSACKGVTWIKLNLKWGREGRSWTVTFRDRVGSRDRIALLSKFNTGQLEYIAQCATRSGQTILQLGV